MDIPETKCICIYHKGSYDTLGKSYAKIMKYIEDNKLEIKEYPRECYIDGIWNKDNVEDWLTEIQVPIKQKESETMAFDYKKEYKEFYMPKNKPSIVEIPKMNYIAVRGNGNPNEENGDYQNTIGLLYGVAYTIKMSYK